MKKIFAKIAACIMAVVVLFLITINFIKTNIPLEYKRDNVAGLYIFNQSTTKSISYTDETFTDGPNDSNIEWKDVNEILDNLNQITNVPIFTRLVNRGRIDDNIEQDLGGMFNSYSTEMKQSYIAVEIVFSESQDFVVYYKGDSRVLTAFAIMYVIFPGSNYDEVLVYYSETSNGDTRENEYTKNKPMVLYGISKQFTKFIRELDSNNK